MIRPLRRAQPWLVGGVAIVALPLAVAALIVRESPEPEVARATSTTSNASFVWSPPVPVHGTFDGTSGIHLAATKPLKHPDLLVYWAPGVEGEAVPPDAKLLGVWSGEEPVRFDLPHVAPPGHLILYSLAHAQRLATAELAVGR